MSIIEKGFGDPSKPIRLDPPGPAAPNREDNASGAPRFDLTSGSGQRRGKQSSDWRQTNYYSPGNPPPGGEPPDGHAAPGGQDDRGNGAILRREKLRPAPTPYLQAVNEAYQPVIENEEEDAIDLARYWRVVQRHKWGILSVALIVLIVGTLNALSKTPIYRAQTTLVAEPFQRKVTVKDEYINSAAVFLFYDTQFDIIRSRAVAERVVDNLGLVARAKTEQDKKATETEPEGGVAALVNTVTGWFNWRNWVSDAEEETVAAPPTDEELREGLIAQLRGGVSVQGGKQSQIINIFYEHENPREAARRANAVARAYVAFGDDTRSDTWQKTNQWLQDQIVEVRKALKQSESALLAYQESTGLVDTGQQQTVSNDRLKQVTEQLVEAKSRRAEAQLRFEQGRALVLGGGSLDNMPTTIASSNLRQLTLEVSKAEREVGELQSRVTDQHPAMKEASVKLAETRKALERERAAVVNTLRNEYEVADSKVREIESLLDQENTRIGEATGATLELIRLEREVENQRKLYEALLVRLQESDVTSELDASNIQILDAASVPQVPFKPNKMRMILLAAVLGVALGVMLAFLREHLDRTLKTMDDVEEKLGLTALGIVPLVRGRKDKHPEREYLENPRSPFAEKINHIRTGLLFSSIDNPPHTFLLTSATGSEGKTTLAINLAAAFSQLDRTLLLEVDLRKPAIGARLGLPGKVGLTELMIDPGVAHEAIQPLGEGEKLFVLTCGTRPHNPLETVSSQQFADLLGRLREHFTYIVLDGPPLLAVSDAAVLGHMADATIVVSKAEATSLQMIKDALSLLRKARVEPTGAVLAQTDARRMAYYGGSYYHYDKRYYGEGHEPEKAAG